MFTYSSLLSSLIWLKTVSSIGPLTDSTLGFIDFFSVISSVLGVVALSFLPCQSGCGAH